MDSHPKAKIGNTIVVIVCLCFRSTMKPIDCCAKAEIRNSIDVWVIWLTYIWRKSIVSIILWMSIFRKCIAQIFISSLFMVHTVWTTCHTYHMICRIWYTLFYMNLGVHKIGSFGKFWRFPWPEFATKLGVSEIFKILLTRQWGPP